MLERPPGEAAHRIFGPFHVRGDGLERIFVKVHSLHNHPIVLGQFGQIVFADDELIAMYWHGDYLYDTQSSVSPDGGTVTITWQSGRALLTRDGEANGHIVVHEEGQPDATFDVKRDNQ